MSFVSVDPPARALVISAYLVLLLVFLFGYDYSNFPIALGAVGFIVILTIGILLSGTESVYKNVQQIKKGQEETNAIWGLVALIALGVISLATNAAFGLPVAVAPALSQVSLNTAVAISFVFNVGAGIAEEMLNLAVFNVVLKLSKSAYWAIGTSGLVRAIYHIPVYGDTGPNFFIVLGAGIVLSTVLWITRVVSVAMGAHIASNVLVAVKALVTGS